MIYKFISGKLDIIIAAAVGFAIILLLTYPHGVGISPDSIVYSGTARNIIATHKIYSFDNSPLSEFPPFYPIFLSTLMFFSGHDIIEIAPFVNAFLFGLVIFFSGMAISRFEYPSKWLKWILLLLIVTSISILRVYFMLWSETLFILITILFSLAFFSYFKTLTYKRLIVAAILVALGCVTRYAGISLIGAGCLLILCNPQLMIRRKILHIIMFGFIASSLPAINLIRNYSLAKTLTGDRKPSITSLADNIYYCGKAVISWIFPSTDNMNIIFFIGFITGLVLLILFLSIYAGNIFNSRKFYSLENIFVALALVYLSFMIISATVSRYEEIDYRLMSPLFIPLTLGLGGSVINRCKKIKNKQRKWVIGVALFLAALFEVNQVSAFYTLPNQDSYSDSEWRNSGIVAFLKANKSIFRPGHTLYTNSNYAMYFFTGLDSESLPDKESPDDLKNFYSEENIYLIWFTKDENDGDMTLNEILKNKPMTLVKQLDDGWIYQYDQNQDSLKSKQP